ARRHVVGDPGDAAVFPDEDEVQRDEGVLHPHGYAEGRVPNEQHAPVPRELGAAHQTNALRLGGVGDLHRERGHGLPRPLYKQAPLGQSYVDGNVPGRRVLPEYEGVMSEKRPEGGHHHEDQRRNGGTSAGRRRDGGTSVGQARDGGTSEGQRRGGGTSEGQRRESGTLYPGSFHAV